MGYPIPGVPACYEGGRRPAMEGPRREDRRPSASASRAPSPGSPRSTSRMVPTRSERRRLRRAAGAEALKPAAEQEEEVLRGLRLTCRRRNLPGDDAPAVRPARRRRQPRHGDGAGSSTWPASRRPLAPPTVSAPRKRGQPRDALFDVMRRPEFGYLLLADEARDAGRRKLRRAHRLNPRRQLVGGSVGKYEKAGRPDREPMTHQVRRKVHRRAANRLWRPEITQHRTNEGSHAWSRTSTPAASSATRSATA